MMFVGDNKNILLLYKKNGFVKFQRRNDGDGNSFHGAVKSIQFYVDHFAFVNTCRPPLHLHVTLDIPETTFRHPITPKPTRRLLPVEYIFLRVKSKID